MLSHARPMFQILTIGFVGTFGMLVLFSSAGAGDSVQQNDTTLRRQNKGAPVQDRPQEERMIDVEGARLYGLSSGAGEPVVVVHGGPGVDSLHMLPLMDLADDFRVIFYDQRGTGRSTGEITRETMTVDRFVEDLEAVRAACDLDRMHLIGHSWGGGLAMHYAVKYPQRLKSFIVMGCAGANTESLPAMRETLQKRTQPEDIAALENIVRTPEFAAHDPKTLERHMRIALKPFFHDPKKIVDMDLRMLPATAQNQTRVQELIGADLGEFDLYDQIGVIKCPSLIVHGESDPDPLVGAQKLQRSLPDARLVVLKDCGHFMFVEQRARTISALRTFLARVTAK